MIVYRDVFSGDELFSDAFPHKEVNDFIIEVYGKHETKSTKIDESMFGGNASADAQEEDDGAAASGDICQSGINIVTDFGLQQTGFGTKKEFQNATKTYVKNLLEYLNANGQEDVAKKFKSEFGEIYKGFFDNFKKYEFYIGATHFSPDGEKEGMAIPMRYENEGTADERAVFAFVLPGLIKEKC